METENNMEKAVSRVMSQVDGQQESTLCSEVPSRPKDKVPSVYQGLGMTPTS